MAIAQKSESPVMATLTYVISWIVGVGVFALLILAALSLVQE